MTTIEKIKAELHATAEMHEDGDYYLRDKWVDEIIDKYAQQEPCEDAEQIDYHDDFETALRKIHDYEERQKQNDKRCGNCKLIGTDSCYMVCGGSKSLYKPKQKSEPCDDAVSRKEVLDLCDSKDPDYKVTHFKEDVECLPPVIPQEQTGKWILLDECANSGYYCSGCHKKIVEEGWSKTVINIKFCPNCGAKMESEVRDEKQKVQKWKQKVEEERA